MSANRIREAGRERYVRERAAAGDSPATIAAALCAEGVKVTPVAVRAILAQDAADRRKAAESVAAAQAVSGTELVIASLTELVEQGRRIAAALAKDAVADSRAARAWSEVARSAVAANHALHGIVSGQKPVTTASVEEIAKRVRAVYGIEGAQDVAAAPGPVVH